MKIKVVIWQENGVWCGYVPALTGCHTHKLGKTVNKSFPVQRRNFAYELEETIYKIDESDNSVTVHQVNF